MHRIIVFAALVALGTPGVSYAGPVYFDFSTLSAGGKVTNLDPLPGSPTSHVIPGSPITAQAFMKDSTGHWVPSRLIARNENQDHGLGVCSEGLSNCAIGGTGGGDSNELSQLTNEEAILLALAPGWTWTELRVSSLDSGDSPAANDLGENGKESGLVFWGNSSDVATLLLGSSFAFEYTNFGSNVEGNILGLGSAGLFNKSARDVLFRPGGSLGANNDYLVYGATVTATPTPEPATLTLLGLGLAGVRAVRRRRA